MVNKINKFKKAKVMLATPCYGNMVTTPYMNSVINLKTQADKQNLALDIKTCGNESLIPRARNMLTAMFLHNSEYSHLLFIDADIEFQPQAVFRMLEFGQDIVSGIYPKKHIDWQKVKAIANKFSDNIQQRALNYNLTLDTVFNNDNESGGEKKDRKITAVNGFIPVLDATTGFMLIARRVFENMAASFPELEYVADHPDVPLNSNVGNIRDNGSAGGNIRYFAFFDCLIDPKTKRYLSEDYAFCRRWQQLGGKIWGDLLSPLSHVGTYTFVGDVSRLVNVV